VRACVWMRMRMRVDKEFPRGQIILASKSILYYKVADSSSQTFANFCLCLTWIWVGVGYPSQELVDGYLTNLDTSAIFASITHLSSYFNRYYTTETGREAVLWLEAEYKLAAGNRPDVIIQLFEHDWAQPSLLVTILGKGANKAETVILGGHIDSTAGTSTNESPGADDDASGSSVVLEVFRTLMKSRFEPDRTIEFHAYAAEEVGLRGSQAIAEEYDAQARNVVSMVQVNDPPPPPPPPF
jgi:leucyl aminopeptidase